jgi:hypothetical protein
MIWRQEGRKLGWRWYFDSSTLYSLEIISLLVRHVDHDGLWVRKRSQGMNSAFPPLSTLLGTSERRIQHHQANTIDTNHAALELARNAQCLVDVLSEHASHEAEVGVVGQRHGLFFRLEGLDDADGAEDLLTVDF